MGPDLFIPLLPLLFLLAHAEPPIGSVVLDEVTFGKIVPKHDIVLVKFDQMYPWGEHIKEWKNLVKRLGRRDDMLLAEVPIADFGEKQNEKLAMSFNVKTKMYDYPQYRLFLKGKGLDAIPYKGNNKVDDITKFIIMTTGKWLQLPGCVVEFDNLIKDFLNKTKEELKNVIDNGKNILGMMKEEETKSARTYIKIMERLTAVDGDVESRKALLEEDLKRTDKILMLEKVHPEKIESLQKKMNIIGSFFYNGMSSGMPLINHEDIKVQRAEEEEEEEEEEDYDGMNPSGYQRIEL